MKKNIEGTSTVKQGTPIISRQDYLQEETKHLPKSIEIEDKDNGEKELTKAKELIGKSVDILSGDMIGLTGVVTEVSFEYYREIEIGLMYTVRIESPDGYMWNYLKEDQIKVSTKRKKAPSQ